MILTLIGSDEHDGATEPAGPRLAILTYNSCIREAGKERPCRGRTSVERHPRAYSGIPGSPVEVAGARRPSIEDVLAKEEEVRFAFPGWPQKSFPVCSVENGDFHPGLERSGGCKSCQLLRLDGYGDVICGDVEEGGFGGVVVEDVVFAQRSGNGEGRLCRGDWCGVCSGRPRLDSGRQGPACH